MFCGNCGNSIPAGQHFCLSCGTPVRTAPAPAAAPPPPPAFSAPAAPRAATPYPSAPVYTPPAPAPAYQPPAYSPPAAYAPAASAAPPSLHWGLVLVLSFVTGGLFGMIWFFIQASYVKRIDPTSKARMLLVVSILLSVAYVVVAVAGALVAAAGSETAGIAALAALALGMLLLLAGMVCMLVAVFGMRSSLVTYFNSVEPINLRLSGVMTFFFNMLYFQYHLSRIADWKRTGVLT